MAIEYKQELSEHRFNMEYFFDRRNWKENKNGVLRMPWAMQVEFVWRDEMTEMGNPVSRCLGQNPVRYWDGDHVYSYFKCESVSSRQDRAPVSAGQE
ncbi:hypothetical protein MCOR02_012107 [Pyricularia oryzae]|nr:hypothetical protein MCOR02_012107 [Pyricularia oryzae]